MKPRRSKEAPVAWLKSRRGVACKVLGHVPSLPQLTQTYKDFTSSNLLAWGLLIDPEKTSPILPLVC